MYGYRTSKYVDVSAQRRQNTETGEHWDGKIRVYRGVAVVCQEATSCVVRAGSVSGWETADKADPCSGGSLRVWTGGGTRMPATQSLALALLACLRCPAAAVLLASHVSEPMSMKERQLARSSAICSQVSGLMPNAYIPGGNLTYHAPPPPPPRTQLDQS